MDEAKIARFWSKVIRTSDESCWVWVGTRDRQGYGEFSWGRKADGKRRAHRVSYELANGPTPEGKLIMHSCDNPSCVNPAHLSVGTHLENIRDSLRKGRSKRRGEDGLTAKLTEVQALQALRLAAAGVRHREIGARFGVCRSTVSKLVQGKLWGHLANRGH